MASATIPSSNAAVTPIDLSKNYVHNKVNTVPLGNDPTKPYEKDPKITFIRERVLPVISGFLALVLLIVAGCLSNSFSGTRHFCEGTGATIFVINTAKFIYSYIKQEGMRKLLPKRTLLKGDDTDSWYTIKQSNQPKDNSSEVERSKSSFPVLSFIKNHIVSLTILGLSLICVLLATTLPIGTLPAKILLPTTMLVSTLSAGTAVLNYLKHKYPTRIR